MAGWFDDNPPPQSAGAAPAGGAAQDPQAYFQSLTQGKPPTPATLNALEGQLGQQGIKVVRNAAGVAGKIKLPDGSIVDVIEGAGAGGKAWQWGTDNTGQAGGMNPGIYTGGGQYPLASLSGTGLMAPWTTPFQRRDPNEIAQDPAFKFQMQQGMEALQRSAAAKGTLLTGGAMKDAMAFGSGLASSFENTAYNRDIGEYGMANSIFNQNQQNQYGRLSDVAGMGQNTASAYGNTAAGLITGAGNATAAGQAGSASAWSNGLQGVGNAAGQAAMMYPWYRTGGGQWPGTPPYAPSNVQPQPWVGPMDYGQG